MAEKSENFMQMSEITSMKMAVIEYREEGGFQWREYTKYDNVRELGDSFLRGRCEALARHYPKAEFRWRYGTLTLDPSDKCEIFKSE